MRKTFFILTLHLTILAQAQMEFSASEDQILTQKYQSYIKSGRKCQAVNAGPRVILTGFGLFEGVSFNISGAIISNLASQDFWPDLTEASTTQTVSSTLLSLDRGILNNSENGFRIYNRSLWIDHKQVSACLILLDVEWDISAAILIHEMIEFQPQVVVMTGLNGTDQAELEAAAVNESNREPGFFSNGKPDSLNTPLVPFVNPQVNSPPQISMNWDQTKIAANIQPLLEDLQVSLSTPSGPAASNDYICNDISFIALEALKNQPLHLADGGIELYPNFVKPPKIGFFHYPVNARFDSQELFTWSRVLLTITAQGL